MTERKWAKFAALPLIAIVSLVVDRASKQYVMSYLQPGQSWSPIAWISDWFSFTYVTNSGAAFGLFPDRGMLFMIIAVVVVIAIAVYYWHMPSGQWLIKLSLGLQLGGATGNLIDRVQYGHVVDFLDFKLWPVFNLADTSIVIGVALLVFALLREPAEDRTTAAQGKDAC